MKYITGDLFNHNIIKETYILHINNNLGAWGAGFVIPLGQKYPLAHFRYKMWYHRGCYYTHNNYRYFFENNERVPFELGQVQPIKINNTIIVNMIAQDGFPSQDRPKAVDYNALSSCLEKVAGFCKGRDCEIIMPLIGAGIGGGSWSEIEKIIQEKLSEIDITIYQLPGQELR